MAYRKIIILNLVVLLALVCIPFEGVATAASANSNMELVVAVPSLYDEVPFPFAGPFMNKVYQTEIVISSDSLMSARITTTFEDQSLDAILNVLSATLDLEVRKNNGEIILTETN